VPCPMTRGLSAVHQSMLRSSTNVLYSVCVLSLFDVVKKLLGLPKSMKHARIPTRRHRIC
jgi:hypothetical protein